MTTSLAGENPAASPALSPGQVDRAARSLIGAGMVVALGAAPAAFAPWLYDDFTLAKQSCVLLSAALILGGLALAGEWLPRRRTVAVVFGLLAGWTTLAWLGGADPRGSLLGVYQYRQGYLTSVAYFALFLGGMATVRMGLTRWAIGAAAAGGVAVVGYTMVQSIGADPVDWWVDTAARAIGTIGNANELASYALMGIPVAGLAMVEGRPARNVVILAATTAAVTFVILQSESRSGLGALGVAILAAPVAAAILRHGTRRLAIEMASLMGGAALGLALSLLAGAIDGEFEEQSRPGESSPGSAAVETLGRVEASVSATDRGASTRLALWKGSIPTVLSSPFWGYGPDGLHLAFPQHRPAGLGGVFESYDLVAQSSHNLALDTAANTGLVGLGASVALVMVVAGGLGRREARAEGDAIVLAGMAGYLAMTMLNPLSLAGHAAFVAVLGIMEGRSESRYTSSAPRWPAWPRVCVAVPIAAVLCAVALAQVFADARADDGWDAYARGDFELAAERYGAAASLLSISRNYARMEAKSWLRAAAYSDEATHREQAEAAYRRYDERFGAASNEVFELAALRIAQGGTVEETSALIQRATELNPRGLRVDSYAATLTAEARAGARNLTYDVEEERAFVASE